MLRREELGAALSQLRDVVGLSIDECAVRLGVERDQLQHLEGGAIDVTLLDQLAHLYGLDVDDLSEGLFRASGDTDGATVFLLQGDYQDFDANDLGVLSRAMLAARRMTVLGGAPGAAALRSRLEFVPVAPAAPNRVDAARQGYKLARLVRRRLGLGGEPLADVGELLEERLGVAVLVEPLESTRLRAASIVDAGLAGAAAVLGAHDPEREGNPVLARVYLAHELCHILFDPAAPGMVRLALDDLRGGASYATIDALLESRAKGFAAELLLPLDGLQALFGSPAATSDPGEAKSMIRRAREHFGTSHKIAANHLENLGFVSKLLRFELTQSTGQVAAPPTTRLPAASSPPCRLQELLAGLAPLPAASDPVAEAREAAAHVVAGLGREAIAAALDAVARSRPIEATDLLVQHLDDLLTLAEWGAAGRLLDELDAARFPPAVLTGVLTVTLRARTEIGGARRSYFERVRQALSVTWQLSEEQVAAVDKRLR